MKYKSIIAILIVLNLVGCASFVDSSVPPNGQVLNKMKDNVKSIHVSVTDNMAGLENQSSSNLAPDSGELITASFILEIQKHIIKFNQPEKKDNKSDLLMFRFNIKEATSSFERIWFWGSFFSLAIIPYWGDVTVELNVFVVEDGKETHLYQSHREFSMYQHIFLLPLISKSASDAQIFIGKMLLDEYFAKMRQMNQISDF